MALVLCLFSIGLVVGSVMHLENSSFHFHKYSTPVERIKSTIFDLLVDSNNLAADFHPNSTLFTSVKSAIENIKLTESEITWMTQLCEPMWQEEAYTRIQLASIEGKLNILQLCWDVGASSPVHSHGGHLGVQSQCFIRVLQSSLVERIYEIPISDGYSGPLILQKEHEVEAGAVVYMNDEIGVHDVSVKQRAITLHVYIPGCSECFVMPADSADFQHVHKLHYQAYWLEDSQALVLDNTFTRTKKVAATSTPHT